MHIYAAANSSPISIYIGINQNIITLANNLTIVKDKIKADGNKITNKINTSL